MCESNSNDYNQIFEYAYPIDDKNPQKEMLGDKTQKKCIFCGKTSPNVF